MKYTLHADYLITKDASYITDYYQSLNKTKD